MLVFILTFLCIASRHILISAWFNCSEDVHKQVGIGPNEIGAIDMGFLLFYAIGNFILGIAGDSYQQKRVLCISSFVSCVLYFAIIFFSYIQRMNFFGYFVLFSMLGFSQSAISPMTVAIMGISNSKETRGSIIGLWSTNSTAGDMAGYFLSSFMVAAGASWVLVSIVSLSIFTSVILASYCFLPEKSQLTEKKPRISILEAFKLPTVLYYCLCFTCIKLIHLSIQIWIPFYMYETLSMDLRIGGLIMVAYSLGGSLGGILSGVISDKVTDRSFVLLGMMILSVPMIYLLNLELGNSLIGSFVTVFVVGLLISGGSNFLSSVVAADMCDLDTKHEAKSTLTGLINACGGIGASVGQVIVRGKEGVDGLFFVMVGFNVLGVIAIVPVVKKAVAKKRYNELRNNETV